MNKSIANPTESALKSFLIEVFDKTTNNFRYGWGVRMFEKYLKKDPKHFGEELLCKLGLLYDHLALKNKKKRKFYEVKALQIYRRALKKNPNSFKAVWGIGRVWWHRKSKRAIPYALKAYKLARRLKPKKAALYAQGVGLVYESLKDYPKAERWLLKGMREDSKNWEVYLNLVTFYRIIGKSKRAKFYAAKLEKFFKKESPRFKKTPWGKRIQEVIIAAKRELPINIVNKK